MTIGTRIKALRERNDNMSQEALGNLTGLNRVQITKIETGRRKVSSAELNAFAEALDVAPDELLYDGVSPMYRAQDPLSSAAQAALAWFSDYTDEAARMRRMAALGA